MIGDESTGLRYPRSSNIEKKKNKTNKENVVDRARARIAKRQRWKRVRISHAAEACRQFREYSCTWVCRRMSVYIRAQTFIQEIGR